MFCPIDSTFNGISTLGKISSLWKNSLGISFICDGNLTYVNLTHKRKTATPNSRQFSGKIKDVKDEQPEKA